MTRELQQRMSALARAQEVRVARARVKRDVGAARMTLEQAMREPCCQTMRFVDLLLCQPRWGRVRTAKALRSLKVSNGITDGRTIGKLTARQREMLVEASARYAPPAFRERLADASV